MLLGGVSVYNGSMESIEFIEKVKQSMMEQLATPSKLGLVSPDCACAHHDVSYDDYLDVLGLISTRLYDIAAAAVLTKDDDVKRAARVAQKLGKKIEDELFELKGKNLLKGTFFVCALVTSAYFRVQAQEGEVTLLKLRNTMKAIAENLEEARDTNGAYARETYGISGALEEAREGYPYVFETALPIYLGFIAKGLSKTEANQRVLLRLISGLDDTCVYHRAPSLAADVKTIADYLCNNFNEENLKAALSYFDRCSISTGGSGDMLTLILILTKIFR